MKTCRKQKMWCIFKTYLIIFTCFLKNGLKNKTLQIKFIFQKCFKNILNSQIYFYSIKYYTIFFKNNSQKLFSKIFSNQIYIVL